MSVTSSPLGSALGFRRIFTSDDVPVYDMFEWETRDAMIHDWRTGEVAFEQPDVEVPASWSINASNILAQKYFRGTLGTPARESSLRQVADRVVDTITGWGVDGGYFADDDEARVFADELKFLIVSQRMAFNSPVWFNIGVEGVPQQASACFILSVDDTMESILNWYAEEGMIFKGGSGAGVNLSRIRSSAETLNGGGTPSGPVSFMRGADASAGTIKSGGKTRRAAKMVMLDVDHPDVQEFVWCKAREENKARALRDAGFDMDLDGADSFSIQYQNANNSVRVTDEFMTAVVNGDDWHLKAVTTGEIVKTVPARDLMAEIAKAAWECADPGVQYDTTINRWHTTPSFGRINGSNPCFPGDSLVHTDRGLVRFDQLIPRIQAGETFEVYTHDVTNEQGPSAAMHLTSPECVMITGNNPIVALEFSNGMTLRCTPNHSVFVRNQDGTGRWVAAEALTEDDEVCTLDLEALPLNAHLGLPVSSNFEDYRRTHDSIKQLNLPKDWSADFAHYLGWLVGDGSVSANGTVSAIYGNVEEQDEILPKHRELLRSIIPNSPLQPSKQHNGTVQLRATRQPFTRFLDALGLRAVRAPEKEVPWVLNGAPTEMLASFLSGLFDTDGTVVCNEEKGSYVGLGSTSKTLLVGVQRLLTQFGIRSRVYRTKQGASGGFSYIRTDGTEVGYASAPMYDLRITSTSVDAFARHIGFTLPSKARRLESVFAARKKAPYTTKTTTRLVSRLDDGYELTYNLTEPRNHSYVVNGLVVRNCSEYMHVDNSACNLASLNLLAFHRPEETGDFFEVDEFVAATEVVFAAQEIIVGRADYPTEQIGENTRRFRQLGLGYANLGALLMAAGAPYDSDRGRALAGAVTALMGGSAYNMSTRLAARVGAFEGYEDDASNVERVLGMHRAAVNDIDASLVPLDLLSAAHAAWDDTCVRAAEHGVRNAQATVLAPTGCIVGGSLISTSRGLVRLRTLGDPDGETWQSLDVDVMTDDGTEPATKFFVNGLSPVVDIRTRRGYRITGTPEHRIRVVDDENKWVWRRFGEIAAGDLVPLALGSIIGEAQDVRLPPLSEKTAWAGEWHVSVPRKMTPELAELIGYFMGDGSLHSRGLRLCMSDLDVADHFLQLAKELFGIDGKLSDRTGYTELALHSTRLVEWWEASGFAKLPPFEGHQGKGYVPRIPDAVLHSNSASVYCAFLRGLFEADGTVSVGYPSVTTAKSSFSEEIQALLLCLGFPTTVHKGLSGRGSTLHVIRLLNRRLNRRWLDEIGFVSRRKYESVDIGECPQASRYDHIPVDRLLIDRVVPANGRLRRNALLSLRRHGGLSRSLAIELLEVNHDDELSFRLGFFFDRVEEASVGREEFTFDISVPEKVTYLANGFVSHNTISFLMDCDTTGIEPDLGLVKMKKLVGGGTMQIVNQGVGRALSQLGYDHDDVEAIVAHIGETGSVLGAPGLADEHVAVFACSMGDNVISPNGHVQMMAAVQPFLSGAISKTVNTPESTTVEEFEEILLDSWRLGLKAVALYRDNCKVAQPLTAKSAADSNDGDAPLSPAQLAATVARSPQRERLPRSRSSKTFEFRVADCKGFVTVGEYDDGRPGELFIRVSKQGSTLAGIMDAFAISVSHGLQYGVPLAAFVDAFVGMRFEPAGMTDDADLRIASSLMDYLFRRLAVEYMTLEDRQKRNILTTGERSQPTLPGVAEAVEPSIRGIDVPSDPPSGHLSESDSASVSDAPFCGQCGTQMVRAGSCHACRDCGSTSGCS